MSIHIDQKFIFQLQTLVKEVLTDESHFYHKNEQNFAVLHNRIFNKNDQTPFNNITPLDKEAFKKYFYLNNNIFTPRPDVPFGDSPENQAFFFDTLRSQVKVATYNFDKMEYLRPDFDEKATDPSFNANQLALLLRGIIYPLVYSVEQKTIKELEKKNTPAADDTKADQANPYDQLGEKLLVQGESGEFDVVLTYDQLAEIAEQEKQLRSNQSLDPSKIAQLLKEYIQKRFPDLHLKLTADGKIITFLSASGFSAGGNLQDKDAKNNLSYLPPANPNGQSFTELLKEMKLRQGKKLQYDAIISSDYKVGIPVGNFAVENSNLNGLSVEVVQGSTVIFFIVDQKGVPAKVTVDLDAYRNEGKSDYHLSIYDKSDLDAPNNKKLTLKKPQLPELKKPLLVLYSEVSKETTVYQTAGYLIIPTKSTDDIEAPQFVPYTDPGGESSGQSKPLPTLLPFSTGTFTPGSAGLTFSKPKPKFTEAGLPIGANKIMPKIPATKLPAPAPKPIQQPEQEEEEQQEQPASETQGEIQPTTDEGAPGGTTAGVNAKKKGLPKGLIVAASAGVPIVGALSTAFVNLLLGFNGPT